MISVTIFTDSFVYFQAKLHSKQFSQRFDDPFFVLRKYFTAQLIIKYKSMSKSQMTTASIMDSIQSFEAFYGLDQVDSLQSLVSIIIDEKKSFKFFKQKFVTISSIFDNQQGLDLQKSQILAQKYSFQKLVDKFPKPKAGTNKVLLSILEKKMRRQVITSHQTRKNIWLLATGAKFSMNTNKGLYESLLKYDEYPSYYMRSIKQDLHRSVNKNTSYSSEQDIQALKNVLIAFSRRNPFVGYCQGLNFIAFFLLTMQFTQQQAFWLLSVIIETIIPMDYYTNMIGVICDQQIFIGVLKVLKPHIVSKFDEVGLDPSVLSIEWFVCLFTSSLPFYLVKIVWDRLLVEGTRAFIKAGIIILSHFEKQIMKVTQFHEIILLLEKGSKKLDLDEAAFNAEFQKIYINKQGLKITRNLERQYHIMGKLTQKVFKGRKKSEDQPQCNLNWPICVQNLDNCKRDQQQIQIWIFRQQKQPHVIHDYLIKMEDKPKNLKPTLELTKKKSIQQGQKASTQIKNQLSLTIQSQNLVSSNDSEAQIQQNHNKKTMINNSNLVIGRMEHICVNHRKIIDRQKKTKKSNTSKFLSMIMEDELQNDDKKIQNFKKIMKMSSISGENEQKIESKIQEQEVQRSQTLLFYSKFVNDNLQLSQIIGPVGRESVRMK